MANNNPSYEFEEEDEEEGTEEEETEEEEEADEEDGDFIPLMGVTRVSQNLPSSSAQSIQSIVVESEGTNTERISRENNVDGLYCTICTEPWTSKGDHQVSCLPCGHIYGMSCIKRWIQQCGRSYGKCPQCNRRCILKEIIKLYTSRIVVVDEDLQKKVESLEAENGSLRIERANLFNIHDDLLTVQADLHEEIRQLKESACDILMRTVAFIKTRTRRTGLSINTEAAEKTRQMQELLEQLPVGSQDSTGRHDVFSQVMGLEHLGRIRGLGLGLTSTQLWGSSLSHRGASSSSAALEEWMSDMERQSAENRAETRAQRERIQRLETMMQTIIDSQT